MASGEFDLDCLASYPEASDAVRSLLRSVQAALGNSALAIWFDGSVALGEFDPTRSDIDLVVLADDLQSEAATTALRAAHAHSATADSPWRDEIEAVYVTTAALNSTAMSRMPHLYVERTSAGELRSGTLDRGWLVHRRVLKEHGRSITGPAPAGLIDAVTDDELRDAVRGGAARLLNTYRHTPEALDRLGARVFVALTCCRLLYTLQTGQVVSKTTAGRWLLGAIAPRMVPVIEGALAWRKGDIDSHTVTSAAVLGVLEWTAAACMASGRAPR